MKAIDFEKAAIERGLKIEFKKKIFSGLKVLMTEFGVYLYLNLR